MNSKIVKIVNGKEETADKLECHLGQGILHKAFSVLIFKNPNELLIQQRSLEKLLWPLYWSNTCCSHPKPGETYEHSAKRRLQEEMGFTSDLKFLYEFTYHAKFEKNGKLIGSENEICAVLIGKYNNQNISPNKKEVSSFKWITLDELEKDIKSNPDKYTPWFKQELKEITTNHTNSIKELFKLS